MSRIGIKPIPVPSGVQVTIGDGNAVTVKGPKGELSHTFSRRVSIAQESSEVKVARSSEDRESRSLHGLSRALLNNMVVGVKDGFTKNLEIQGVGYRAAMEGSTLVLNVGYSHQVRI